MEIALREINAAAALGDKRMAMVCLAAGLVDLKT